MPQRIFVVDVPAKEVWPGVTAAGRIEIRAPFFGGASGLPEDEGATREAEQVALIVERALRDAGVF